MRSEPDRLSLVAARAGVTRAAAGAPVEHSIDGSTHACCWVCKSAAHILSSEAPTDSVRWRLDLGSLEVASCITTT
jgi:hypothetical protein